MDPALGSALSGAAQQGGFALIAVLLLWFVLRELKEYLKSYDAKLDKQSEGIAYLTRLHQRLLQALGEKE